MGMFRKKPVVIEARQYDGTPASARELINWTRNSKTRCYMDVNGEGERQLSINTLEGALWVSVGDWIIKGVANEFYPCKPDIFERSYEQE